MVQTAKVVDLSSAAPMIAVLFLNTDARKSTGPVDGFVSAANKPLHVYKIA